MRRTKQASTFVHVTTILFKAYIFTVSRLNFHIFPSQGPTGEIDLVEGQTFKLSLRKEDFEKGDSDMVYVDYANLGKTVNKGSKIFMDDGLICLRVKEIADDHVITVVENSGKLGSKKGINLPEAIVDLPAISEKDKADIMFGVENGVSWKLLGPQRYIYSLRLPAAVGNTLQLGLEYHVMWRVIL